MKPPPEFANIYMLLNLPGLDKKTFPSKLIRFPRSRENGSGNQKKLFTKRALDPRVE